MLWTEAKAWLRSAFDRSRSMQRSRHKIENGDGPPGIRAGVWVAVLSFFLACMLLMVLFPRSGDWVNNKAPPGVPPEPVGKAPAHPAAVARATRQRSNPEFYAGRDLWFPAPQNVEEATRLACDAANQKARELYDCEPFGHERAAVVVDGRWIWSDFRGRGRGDLEATVEFAADGSLQKVDVLWLDSAPDRF